MSFEPKIDEAVQQMSAPEAFQWLLKEFRAYAHNETNWMDVKSVLLNAEALPAKWQTPAQETEEIPAE